MVNFITAHILNKIYENTIDKYKDKNETGFIFFNKPVVDNNYVIDRVNRHSPFRKNEIVPKSWYQLKGKTILYILNQLKQGSVHKKIRINDIKYKVNIDDT